MQGIELKEAQLCDYGLRYDRQWMLVDENNQFLSQRKLPHMAQFKTSITGSKLIVSHLNESIELDLTQISNADCEVTIWGDTVKASLESDTVNTWFSQQLMQPCKLVKLAKDQQRKVDSNYAKNNENVGFADGFPLLVLSYESINLLNSKLSESININRFRPNIIINGLAAHEEDNIKAIQIGNITIQLAKPCSRCVIPSIDQTTGEKNKGVLPALVKYRKKDNQVFFGMNGLHQSLGKLKQNAPVTIK